MPRATDAMLLSKRVSEVRPSPSSREKPSRPRRLLSDLNVVPANKRLARFSDAARLSSLVLMLPRRQAVQSTEHDTYYDVTKC